MYNISKVRHRAQLFREECRRSDCTMPAEDQSNAITAIQAKDTAERRIFRGLIERYETFIMPGSRPGFYRISHMGLQTDEELRTLAERIHLIETEIDE